MCHGSLLTSLCESLACVALSSSLALLSVARVAALSLTVPQGGYEHYMQKEIHEQPESLLQTMSGRVKFQRQAVGNPYLTPRVKLGGFVETAATIRM